MSDTRPAIVAIYLDVCRLNRPFDDPSQTQIQLEAAAVTAILSRLQRPGLRWISSEVVDFEISQIKNLNRRTRVRLIIEDADERVAVDDPVRRRARELERVGFGAADALHVACAERGGADVFLTVDDGILKRATRAAAQIAVRILNPLDWLGELERRE